MVLDEVLNFVLQTVLLLFIRLILYLVPCWQLARVLQSLNGFIRRDIDGIAEGIEQRYVGGSTAMLV